MNWFELTVLMSVSVTLLILSFRAISPDTNPFLFMSVVTGLAALALFGFCQIRDISVGMEKSVLQTAFLAACSVTLLDLALIFMFRKSGPVSVVMPTFRASAIMLSTLVGYTLFQETLTPVKLGGIFLACLAVYLLNYKPRGNP